MSELIEKALADLLADLNEADEWLGAARTRRRNAAVKNATKRLSSTLLDDLATAQGEIERLRAEIDNRSALSTDATLDALAAQARADRMEGALRGLEQQLGNVVFNNDQSPLFPETLMASIRSMREAARSALTLKSEEKQGLDLVALLTDTAEGMNELANGLEEDGGYTATVAEIRAQVAMIVAATKTQAPGDGAQQVKP
jgi:hypothetical protein